MKGIFKRTLAIFIASVMVFGAAPLAGLVGLEFPEFSGIFSAKAASSKVGSCGDNLTWVFDETTETLTISGVGDMYDYYYPNRAPWLENSFEIGTVTMEQGVTSIGVCAFDNCDSLTTITIPCSVTNISENAFCYCINLTNIAVDSDNTSYSSDEYGVLFNKDKTLLIQYPIGNARTSYKIPDSVIEIGNDAFYNCDSLTSIEIPISVTSIDDYAFVNCNGLISIKISNGVKKIGNCVFGDCDSITSIEIPNSVIEIGYGVFDGCTDLTRIAVDSENTSYSSDEYGVLFNKDKTLLIKYPIGNERTSYEVPDSVKIIGNYAFGVCDSLTSITFSDNSQLTSIGDGAFDNCDSLTGIKIPDGVTNIGEYAFSDCDSLTSIIIPDGVTNIGESAFYNCYSLTGIEIPDSITSIGDQAFFNCCHLTSISFGENSQFENIGNYAFYSCGFLTSIEVPDSVTSIGDYAFCACYSLTSITFGDNSQLTSIGDYVFASTSLTSITIPDSVTSIGKSAFDFCENLHFIHISSNTEKIETNLHSSNSYFYICSDSENCYAKEYSEENGYIFEVCDGNHKNEENGHSPEWVFSKKYVCTEDNVKIKKCKYCGEVFEEELIYAIDHTPGEWEISKESSCTEDGLMLKKCTVCDEFLEEETIPAGHTPGEWRIERASTCKEKGKEVLRCTVCGEILDTRDIDKKGHRPGDWDIYDKPTPDKKGKKRRHCTDCHDILDDVEMPKQKRISKDNENAVFEYSEEDYNGEVDFIIKKSSDEKPQDVIKDNPKNTRSVVYEISMTLNGNEIQPSAPIRIKLPLPEDYNSNTSYVCYVNTDNNTVEIIPSEEIDGYLVFEAAHFSYYAIVEEFDGFISIRKPSQTEITYGDSIILHADAETLPEGWTIEWKASNEHFSYTVSEDGMTCEISPASSGDTTFTATVYDANRNVISSDEQVMTSKAGFFQKIIAFFKKLFGMTKTIPQIFKGIF